MDRQCFLPYEINDRERVVGTTAIVRSIGSLAIRGCDDFVRIVSDGNALEDFQRCRVHDGECLIASWRESAALLSVCFVRATLPRLTDRTREALH